VVFVVCNNTSVLLKYFIAIVRRQGFWNQNQPNLKQSFALLITHIIHRVAFDASSAF